MKIVKNYINGQWREDGAAEYMDVVNPATQEILARTPLSTSADVDAAVQAAAEAFPAWRRTPPGERVQYFRPHFWSRCPTGGCVLFWERGPSSDLHQCGLDTHGAHPQH